MFSKPNQILLDNETMDTVGSESNYHGTATLSVLAATMKGTAYGAAPKADYLLARTENIFVEERVEEDYFVAGVEWAERRGAHVLSASLGYKKWYQFRDFDGHTPAVTRAAQQAAELGLVVVVANGNEGESGLGAPADARLALSVGACSGQRGRASYSSVGPTADGRLKPDVVTLGSAIVVANDEGGLRFGSGTSYAVPLVAALGALVLQARPKWSAQMVHEAILVSCFVSFYFLCFWLSLFCLFWLCLLLAFSVFVSFGFLCFWLSLFCLFWLSLFYLFWLSLFYLFVSVWLPLFCLCLAPLFCLCLAPFVLSLCLPLFWLSLFGSLEMINSFYPHTHNTQKQFGRKLLQFLAIQILRLAVVLSMLR